MATSLSGIVIAMLHPWKLEKGISMLGNAVLTSPADRGSLPVLSEEIRSVLGSLGVSGRRIRLSKGSMISFQHGRQAGLHLLRDGRMKTLRFSEEGRVMILDLLDSGDVFGEMSLVAYDDDREGEATYAEALEDAEIETFSRFVMERALQGRPSLALAIARLVGDRRRRVEKRLETHVFRKVPARLAVLLLDLADRFGKPGAQGTELDIPLSQQDLGNLIGASREIVSLTLSEFRRRGAVSTVGRRMALNESRLRRELRAGA